MGLIHMPHHNIDRPSGSTIVSRRDRAFTACFALNILNSEDTWMRKAFRELSLQCTAVVAVIGKRSPVRHHSTWWSSEIQTPGNLMKHKERLQVKSIQLLLDTSSLNSWPIGTTTTTQWSMSSCYTALFATIALLCLVTSITALAYIIGYYGLVRI